MHVLRGLLRGARAALQELRWRAGAPAPAAAGGTERLPGPARFGGLMKVRGAAAQLGGDFDAVLAEVIEVAESCGDEQWTRRVVDEERSVGVLFDHIAAGNDQSVEWASAFLRGRG